MTCLFNGEHQCYGSGPEILLTTRLELESEDMRCASTGLRVFQC